MAFSINNSTCHFTINKKTHGTVRFLEQESDDEDYHYATGLLKKRKSVSTPRTVDMLINSNSNGASHISSTITPCPTPDPFKKRVEDEVFFQDIPQSPVSMASSTPEVPRDDIVARERCFDFIVQSIDEVWARYVDSSSTAETKTYYLRSGGNNLNSADSSFQSTSDDSSCFEDDVEVSEDDGYNSEVTSCTEFDESNIKSLQSLKYRLTNAKNDLELNYDSPDLTDSMEFWRRWDMIKYSAVELMEDDDDDELIESVIEELERGRSVGL